MAFSALLIFLAGGALAQSAASATWALTSNGDGTASGNLSPENLAWGSGLQQNIQYGSDGAYTTQWNSNSLDLTDYYEFAVIPFTGTKFTLNQVSYNHRMSSGTMSNVVYCSVDNFATSTQLGTEYTVQSTFGSAPSVLIQGVEVDVLPTQTLRIRVYGWGAAQSNRSYYVRNFQVQGTSCNLPWAAGSISGSSAVCQGQSGVSYSVGSITGATSYEWTYSGSGATITGTSSSVSIAFSSSATAGDLTVRGVNSCGYGAASAVFPVSVNPLPVAAGSITGTAQVCQGQSGVSYSVGSITHASSYVWNYSGTGATISGSGVSVTISFSESSTSGNLTVRGSNSCGDGVVSADYAISVSALPAASGTITGAETVCQGESGVSYSVGAIDHATSYNWNYTGSGFTPSGSSNNITADFSVSATSGVLTVRGVNDCGQGVVSANFNITTDPLPAAAGAISGSSSVCEGEEDVTYSIGTIAHATSYQWSYSGTGVTVNGSGTSAELTFAQGATSGSLTVKGINDCGEGVASAAFPITVNYFPVAAGSISGSSTVCQGESDVEFSVGTITHATSYEWNYTGTGATISGTGSAVTISFSASATAGDLTVRGLNSCGEGVVSAAYAISMNPLPAAAGSISGSPEVCQGQADVDYSVGAVTHATSYEWNYSGSGATISGTGSSVTISFSASATSGNLTVRGLNACGEGVASSAYAVLVDPLPAAAGTITGTAAVCEGEEDVEYSVGSIAEAAEYIWQYTGSGVTINGAGASVTLSFAVAATSGNLTVRGLNECGEGVASANYAITVNYFPVAAGSISGSSTVCQGQSDVEFSVGTITHATSYEWNYTGTGATISGTGSSVTISFSASATAGDLTVRGLNGCGEGDVSAVYPISMNPLPVAAGSISGSPAVCQGQSDVEFSVGTITHADSYVWNYSGSGATISGTGSSVNISFSLSATSGNLTVRGLNACGEGVVSANYAITVNPLPVAAGAITGTATVCQGQSGVEYSVPTINYATSYIWSYSGTGFTPSGTTNSVTAIFSTGATSGMLTVRGENACGEGVVSTNYSITVNPLPASAGVITGTATVCQGQNSVAYSVPAIDQAASYSWSYTGTGFTPSGTTNSITANFSTAATSGVLTVRGVNACGEGIVSSDFSITVNPLPASAGAITGTATVCQGQNGVAYSVATIDHATSYTWSYSGTGFTPSGTTSSITANFAANATGGVLTVRGVNACGEGIVSANYTITVNPLPANSGNITGTATVCQGQNNVAYSVAAMANATSYNWSYSGTGFTPSSTSNSITANFSTTATSGVLTVRGVNACGEGVVSANYSITVNPLPVAAGSITGSSTVCQGQNGVAFSVAAITHATSYTWSFSGTGMTGAGTTNSFNANFSTSATSGILTVRGVNACGQGVISENFVITVNPLPGSSGSITGSSPVCQGQTGVAYSVGAIANATSYIWNYSGNGFSASDDSNSITATFAGNATAGTLTVRGSNACGLGAISPSFSISMNNLPATAGAISGTATVCQGQSGVNFSTPNLNTANSYSWSYSGIGFTPSGTSRMITGSFATDATSGILTVSGVNACGNGPSSVDFPITVNPLPVAAGSITGTATVCQGQNTVAYSVPTIDHATSYTWSYSGTGFTPSGTTSSITANFATNATSGVLTVRGVNACGQGVVSANYSITVNPLPANSGAITGTATVCQGQNTVAYSVGAIANATSYNWSYTGTGFTPSGTTNSITANFSTGATGGILTVRGVNACGQGVASANYSITVNPLPAAAGNITGSATVCQGQSGVAYSVPTIASATSYSWSYSGTGFTPSGTTASITASFSAGATSGVLTVRGVNACGQGVVSANYSITVNPLPVAAGTITGAATVCQGENGAAYSVPDIDHATSYTWNYSGTGFTPSGTTSSITANFATNATNGVLTVRGVNACGQGVVSANYSITVNPLPANSGAITGTATVCQGQNNVSYSVAAIANATSYNWSYSGTGFTPSGTTSSITANFATNATNGVLTVRGVNACGQGVVSANYSITVNPLPANAGAITGSSTVCQGQSGVAYSVGAVANATSYTWTYSGTGFTPSGTTNSITGSFAVNATSGVLTVRGVNACGQGVLSEDYTITVNPLPLAAGTIAGTATTCRGENGVAYAVPVIEHATSYSWNYSGTGFTPSGTTNSITANFAANATSGVLTVRGVNACGQGVVSANYSIAVNPMPLSVAASASSSPVCPGSTVDLSLNFFSPPTTLLSENFNAATNNWTRINNSIGGSTGSAEWTLRPNGYTSGSGGDTHSSNDNSQFYLSDSRAQNGSVTEAVLVSPALNTQGYASLSLTFFHYFRVQGLTVEFARVDVSADGNSWTPVTTYNTTQGAANSFAQETVNLDQYVDNPQLFVRFFYYAEGRGRTWAIDNVTISGTPITNSFSWTSTPAGFTSTSQNPGGVQVNQATTFHGAVINQYGCVASANAAVGLLPSPIGMITGGTTTICAGATSVINLFVMGQGVVSGTLSPGNIPFSGMAPAIQVAVTPGNTTTYTISSVVASGCNANAGGMLGSATVTVLQPVIYYQDADGDGYGNDAVTQLSCYGPPAGYITQGGDCNDNNPDIHPSADEWLNGIDDNCNGEIDEGVQTFTYYRDADGDGFGDANQTIQGGLLAVIGYVGIAGDCDDTNPNVYPGAPEICGNGIDDDCDGIIDEGCGPINDERESALVMYSRPYGECQYAYGTLVGATVSPEEGAESGTGEDVWYYFTSETTTARIACTTTAANVLLELQSQSGQVITTENSNSAPGNEVLIWTNLTAGETYFVRVRNYDSSQGAGNFTMCLNHFRRSRFQSGGSTLSLCQQIKCEFVQAYRYAIKLTPIGGGSMIVHQTAPAITTAVLADIPGVLYNMSYHVTVDAIYNVHDGNGTPTTLAVPSNQTWTFHTGNHITPLLRATDICPNVVSPGAQIGATAWVCGATAYQFEFTPVAPIPGGPILRSNNGVNRFIQLNTVGLMPGYTYNVRVRPLFGAIPGNWGNAYQCIQIAGTSSMVLNGDEADMGFGLEEDDVIDALSVELYPNPVISGPVQVLLTSPSYGTAVLELIDINGRICHTENVTTQAGVRSNMILDVPDLKAGNYVVRVTQNGMRLSRKLMVLD